MKGIIITLLLFSLNSFAGNSRIRNDKICKVLDKTTQNQSIEIRYKVDLIDDCDFFNGPDELSCREYHESVDIGDIANMACFGYVDEPANIDTENRKKIKNIKRLVKIDETGDCRFAFVKIAKDLSCSNYHLSFRKQGNKANPRIGDTDTSSCNNHSNPTININGVSNLQSEVEQSITWHTQKTGMAIIEDLNPRRNAREQAKMRSLNKANKRESYPLGDGFLTEIYDRRDLRD